MKVKLIKKVLFGIILAVLLIPYPTTSIPEWRVQVVDENGNPLANTEVIQEWSNGLILGKSIEKRVSNEEGFVIFPTRKFLCPVIFRLLIRVIDNINYFLMLHGSRVGSWATVWVNGGSSDRLFYQNGKELKGVIVR